MFEATNCSMPFVKDFLTLLTMKKTYERSDFDWEQSVSPIQVASWLIKEKDMMVFEEELDKKMFPRPVITYTGSPESIVGEDVYVYLDIYDGCQSVVELAKTLKGMHPNSLTLYIHRAKLTEGTSLLDVYFDNVKCLYIWKEPNGK